MATPRRIAFELAGADGGPLRGDVSTAGGNRPAVVICHGFKGFKDWGMFPHLSERLSRAGLTAVSFNFSGSGIGGDGQSFTEEARFGHDTFLRQLTDLQTVCRAVALGELAPGVGPSPHLGLFGHSRGGGMAILQAALDPRVKALVTWAAISRVRRWSPETIAQWRADGRLDVVNTRTGQVLPMFLDILDEVEREEHGRLDIPAAAGRVAIPWLILHGDADESVPVEESEVLLRASAGKATLRVINGGRHTFGARHPWQGSTRELDEAMDLTVSWLGRYLLA